MSILQNYFLHHYLNSNWCPYILMQTLSQIDFISGIQICQTLHLIPIYEFKQCSYVSTKLRTIDGNLHLFSIEDELLHTQIGLIKHLYWDDMQTNRQNVKIVHQGKPWHIPQDITIKLADNLRVCKLLIQEPIRYTLNKELTGIP